MDKGEHRLQLVQRDKICDELIFRLESFIMNENDGVGGVRVWIT